MFDFLVKKSAIKNAQKFINKLEPKVNVHVPEDIPLPSLRVVKKLAQRVSVINGFEPAISALSDDQLKAKTQEFQAKYKEAIKTEREKLKEVEETLKKSTNHQEREDLNLKFEEVQAAFRKRKQEFLKEILPEAFAVVREVGKRLLNMRHFDVQMIGGMVLNDGNIAEMTTGEGKTLVATLPTYLNALTGEGVHVVTVNDYLAKRDMEWMSPIYTFLGLSIGVIQHDQSPEERKGAYLQDITYGTNNEFGFDYLRDNMVNYKEEMVQREHHFAVVDEVDSILVDEARTPLIISGPAEESTDKYYKAHDVSKKMKGRRITEKDEIDAKHQEINLGEGYDYLADEKNKSISLTEEGEDKAAGLFGIDNLHDMETVEYRHHMLCSLRAKEFFVKDVDYVVNDGEVIIVDEFTGRMMPGRRWSDGLHQAVEAKEGIKIARENQTLATITFQNYFRMYEKLSGMTGTAITEENEFKQIYDLDCVVIPTNKPILRKNYTDAIYKTNREKYNAVVDEIEEHYKRGQPVLVGTISIEKSEMIGEMLKQRAIPHKVLNAKFHEMEANIISQAGQYKAVTIATNMAGRGTDIVLGGNAEYLAKNLAQEKADDESSEESLTDKFLEEFRVKCKEEHEKVIELGGLHVLGTERHESRRIDNQLRGRQGRQGDPGSSKFFISLEDDLMRLFGPERIIGIMDKLGLEEGQVLEHPLLSRALETAQKRVEGANFDIRKHLLEYDDVMNRQREVVYNLRRTILESESIKHIILDALFDTILIAVDMLFAAIKENGEGDVEGFKVYLKSRFNYDLQMDHEAIRSADQETLLENIFADIEKIYEVKEGEIEVEKMRVIERMLMMNTIDSKWKDHLYSMDQLQDAMRARSYGQGGNPLVEYKKEGFNMFQAMLESLNREVAEIILKLKPVDSPQQPKGVFSSIPQKMIHDEVSGMSMPPAGQAPQPNAPAPQGPPPVPSNEGAKPIQKDTPKVGRNDPCPCGSGKKYKKCCGQ